MAKRITAVVELLAFLVFTTSCVYHVQEKRFAPVARRGSKVKILAVQTKAREYIEFGEKRPARLVDKAVVGEGLTTVEFARADVAETVSPTPTKPGSVGTKDGKRYTVLTMRESGDSLICQAYVPVSIPAPEVRSAWLKTVNAGKSFLQGLGYALVVPVVIGFLVLLVASGDLGEEIAEDIVDSAAEAGPERAAVPPPVYKDFWESYFIDAELHGEAAGRGFKITEWTAVDLAPGPDGRETFSFANELGVLRSVDELKVVVVDHPAGTTVVPDFEGTMHTVSAPAKPKKAWDEHGRDIRPLVEKGDGACWMSGEDERNPRKKEDLRDELILEFPKPAGKAPKRAKLVVSATNTMWASHFAGRFLDMPGLSPVRTTGPGENAMAGGRARDWYREEEFYKLRVWVATKTGWQPRQTIYGGGPFVPRDRVAVMDIGDAAGPALKIKLMPPAGFWMIDRLAVDYSPDAPLDISVPVDPESATASGLATVDALAALSTEDGRYLELPSPADKVVLTFVPPPPKPWLERSAFVRTVSRYEIRPEPGR